MKHAEWILSVFMHFYEGLHDLLTVLLLLTLLSVLGAFWGQNLVKMGPKLDKNRAKIGPK